MTKAPSSNFNLATSCLWTKLQISLQRALNLLSANDAMCRLRAEHSSSLCTTGKEMGLANIYAQDAVSTTSEKLRLSNIPWVSDHSYLPSRLSAYASDSRPSADYSGTSDDRFGRPCQYPKGSCGGSETGYGFKRSSFSYKFCEVSTRAENWYVWQVKTIHYELARMSTLLPQQYHNQHIPGQNVQVACNLKTM